MVVLKPEKWIGRPFPLLPFIEDCPDQLKLGQQPLRKRLAEGDWIVVLYHYDCPKCKQAIVKYEALARHSAGVPQFSHIALIEIPPYGDVDALPIFFDCGCSFGRLSAGKEWFVETPLEIVVKDMQVVRAE